MTAHSCPPASLPLPFRSHLALSVSATIHSNAKIFRRPRTVAHISRRRFARARGASLGVGLLALVAAAPSLAATQVLAPSGDTFINGGSPTNNNGGSSSLFTGTDGHGGLMRALVRFAMPSDLQGRVTVTGVQLRVTVRALPNGTVGAGAVETLARVGQAWAQGNGVGETTMTFTVGQPCGGAVTGATWTQTDCATATPWATPGGTVATSASAQADTTGLSAGAAVVWDSATNPAMKADVQSWIDLPAGNDGWRIASSTEGTSGAAQRFYATESGSNAPSLSVTYSCKAGFVENGTSCVAASVPASRPWSILLLGALLAATSFALSRLRSRPAR
jgi:hypothetical protein